MLAVCFGVLLFSGSVVAQAGGPQATITQLNQQAMAAYGNLQFPEAMQLLQQAESLCNQYNLHGAELARTYVNMGMVEFGGSGNNAGALEYFKKAVCLDRSVMLDPLNSTPDVEMLFRGAQGQAQAPGGCGGAAPQPQPAYPQPQPAYPQPQPGYPQPQPGPATMQLLQHTQVTQQVRLTPIPIFARVNPNVQPGQVILFYRTIGERIYQQVPMQPNGSGYSAMIGCDVLQTFDPTGIEYYIAVLDTANRLLGTSGTEAQPHQTSIVQTLTVPPPAMPNEAPPGACREECPPWNPDCNSACKQFGDLCDSDSECCSGLACIEESCSQTDGDGGGGEGWGEYGPHFRMSINAGTGAGLVTGGAEQPYNQVSDGSLTVGTGFAWSKFHIRANPMIYLPVAKLSIGLSFRGDIPMLADAAKTAVSKNRDVPRSMEPSLLLNVAYRIVGSDDHSGFELDALLGFGWMNILNRVSYQDCPPEIASDDSDDIDGAEDLWGHSFKEDELVCEEDSLDDSNGGWDGSDATAQNFFRKSGPIGVELGVDGYVWFVDNFGLNFGLIADVLFPSFVLNFDIQAGIALRF